MSIGHAYQEPPFYYDNGEAVAVVFRTDADLVRSLLPPVLEMPEGPARVLIRVVNPERSSFGPYRGVYLGVPALLDGAPVLHGFTGIKTSFPGTIAGREVWGMPLQVGYVTKEWHEDSLNVTAGRNGVEFMRLSVRLESHGEAPAPWGGLSYASRRQNIEHESTQNVLINVKRSSSGHEVVQHWNASAVLKLVGGQPGDDWSQFPVHEILDARYSTGGGRTKLDRGEVIAEW